MLFFGGIDLSTFIQGAGYLGLFAIIFAESGVFIGFFLPGDSLLFTAGFLASKNYFDIEKLVPLLLLGAMLGDSFGYWFGRKTGPLIFNKEDSLLFHKKHIAQTQKFYAKHGGKTIIFARFMPVLRTFAPILAGVGKMNYRTFLVYNIMGAGLWVLTFVFFGYFLGKVIPNPDRFILPIIFCIVLVSFIPPLRMYFGSRTVDKESDKK